MGCNFSCSRHISGREMGFEKDGKTSLSLSQTHFFIVWSLLSLNHLYFNFYPKQISPNGPNYKKSIQDNTDKNNLIIIQDPRNYLYARQVYKKRLIKIVKSNKLNGLKLIAEPNFKWGDYSFSRSNLKIYPLRGFEPTKPNFLLNGNRSIYPITQNHAKEAFPLDYESNTKRKKVSMGIQFSPV